MKKVSGTLKLDLAQYRDQQAFSMFASDLDPATRRQLARGERLMELLKQPQYSPYPVEEQVVSIWAGSKGHLDEVPVQDVLRFEREFIDHLRRHTSVLTDIASTGKLEDGTVSALESAVAEFSKGFQSSEDGGVQAGHEEHRAIEQDQVAQEQITKQKR